MDSNLDRYALSMLFSPPIYIRAFNVFTLPLRVLTMHHIGERRLGAANLSTLLFLFLTIAAPLQWAKSVNAKFFPALGWGTKSVWILALVTAAIGLAAAVCYWLALRQCQRELAERKARGIHLHTWFYGVPRFGLPATDYTFRVTLPCSVGLIGLACLYPCPPLAGYLMCSAAAMYMQYVHASWSAVEHSLNEADAGVTNETMHAALRQLGATSQVTAVVTAAPVADRVTAPKL